jgi:hypothetical protein
MQREHGDQESPDTGPTDGDQSPDDELHERRHDDRYRNHG